MGCNDGVRKYSKMRNDRNTGKYKLNVFVLVSTRNEYLPVGREGPFY